MVYGSVSAEKQRIAEEVASMLKLSVDIDTSPSERLACFIDFYCLLMLIRCFQGLCVSTDYFCFVGFLKFRV